MFVLLLYKGTGTSLTASTCNDETDFDTMLSVYSGSSCASLTCVVHNDDGFCAIRSSVSSVQWTAELGVTYFLVVHGYGGDNGRFGLSFTSTEIEANVECQGATIVSSGTSLVSSTTGGPVVLGTPTCQDIDVSSPGKWYSLEGTGSIFTVSTCSEDTVFDTILTVYTGSCDSLTCHAQNDDDCFGFAPSTVSFETQQGVTYYILVHGFDGSSGAFGISVEETS